MIGLELCYRYLNDSIVPKLPYVEAFIVQLSQIFLFVAK
jgi:hypothetical protein